VAQRDFFIFFTHRIFAQRDMRHHEINIGKRRLRIGGIAELNLRRLLFEDHFTRFGLRRARRCRKISAPAAENDLVAAGQRTMPWGTAAACDNN
jgi:hypothetical protein